MTELADSNDPYIDGSGKLIEQVDNSQSEYDLHETRKVISPIKSLGIHKEVAIDDLPETDPQLQTVIAAIIGYRLIGLSLVDISEQMNTTYDKITNILSSPAAQLSYERMYKNIISVNSDSIQGRISAHGDAAVDVVVELMGDKDVRDDVRLKASQDILDRMGTNADHFFATDKQLNQADDELRIVITDGNNDSEKVSVEIGKRK